MSKNITIKFENISKQYRLGVVGTGTISHDLNRWWHTVRGKEDPYLRIGQENDRSSKATSDYVWALRDINFEVEQGDVIGIIGKNGAGKSTLLKLLSRVTSPTTGSIKAKGRIASLLEVGTGFHPELTGRENIYMNGAIMGMTKAEITSKLDEIIDFAGVEMYIDTPTKRYSSGMTVRLGFAIAAHLDPEILVVDEVLAVGDAEFQKKAIGKMQDVSRGEGRTVLFVSHNMNSINRLCNKGVLLQNGQVAFTGEIRDVVDKYINVYMLNDERSTSSTPDLDKQKDKDIVLLDARLLDNKQEPLEPSVDVRTPFSLNLKIEFRKFIKHPKITFHFKNLKDEFVLFSDIHDATNVIPNETGVYEFNIPINQPLLKPDTYVVSVGITNMDNGQTNHFGDILKVELFDFIGNRGSRAGYLYTGTPWEVKAIQ